jgi:hypothetical protein
MSDLLFVERCCRALAELPDDDASKTVHRALWEAAVVAYGRSFKSGRGHAPVKRQGRTRIPEAVMQQLTPDEQITHEEVLAERDGHIGHRVDTREGANVRVLLAPPPERQVLNVVMFSARSYAGGPRATKLAELAHRLAELIEPLRQGALLQVAADAQADLDGVYRSASPMPTD